MLIAGTKCVATNGLSLSLSYIFALSYSLTELQWMVRLRLTPTSSYRKRNQKKEPIFKMKQSRQNQTGHGGYAGLDAIVTCFALISSISGSHLSSGQTPFLFFLFQFLHAPHYPIMCLDSEDS
ncbi:hypothetical protein NE237_011878 [Protea cynaroides]|uniref:Uncharacterized protein n=1 Tax=Protea cynaroides TaxID=273540 RepID=A0A9Q0GX04_9MAGN|nr:hypothetical protein NE237_011878 [Protea cynaroides]